MGLLLASCFGVYGNSPTGLNPTPLLLFVLFVETLPSLPPPTCARFLAAAPQMALFSTIRPAEGWDRLDAVHLKNYVGILHLRERLPDCVKQIQAAPARKW